MTASLTDQAIELLVKRGWSMVPSTGTSKGPCVGWKEFQEQLPTVEQLRQWDRKFRPTRWGLVTGKLSGVVVVDFDGAEGIKRMKAWGIRPHRRTGSGGFHCHLKHPGWSVPTMNAKTSKASWPWPGVDIRGDGGFAVVLGRNENGPYEQLRDLDPEPFDALPEEVRTYLRDHSVDEPAPKQPVRTQAPTGGGCHVDTERLIRRALEMAPRGRNDAGMWLACQLRDNGYSSTDADAAMRNYRSRVLSTNAKGQREPYTQSEVKATLRQAYSRPAREPWKKRSTRPHGDIAQAAAPSREPDWRSKDEAPERKEKPRQVNDADGFGSLYLYVRHPGESLVPHTGEALSRMRFGRIPLEVLADRRLKHRDVRVYGVLSASCWQGSVVPVGTRRIARLARCAERLVTDSLIRALEVAGHIKKQPGLRRGQRGRYVLLSPIFGQKQRDGVEEVVMGPDGHMRLVTVRKDQKTAWTSHSALLKRSNRTKSRS
jgi:hypothetical protein